MVNREAQRAKAYLDELCRRIDRRHPLPPSSQGWRRIATVALAAGMATSSCGGQVDHPVATHVSESEDCRDAVDNDGDGQVDCGDLDCRGIWPCLGAEYAAPSDEHHAEDCSDGIDNDGDGHVDCRDLDCIGVPPCADADVQSAETCDDGVDNDGDGHVDCGDLDCMGIWPCPMGAEYAAPF